MSLVGGAGKRRDALTLQNTAHALAVQGQVAQVPQQCQQAVVSQRIHGVKCQHGGAHQRLLVRPQAGQTLAVRLGCARQHQASQHLGPVAHAAAAAQCGRGNGVEGRHRAGR